MLNAKSCVLFVSHKIDDHSLEQFERYRDQLKSRKDIDIYYCTLYRNPVPSSINGVLYYENDSIKMKDGTWNTYQILEDNYKHLSKNNYDYYYIIEYDVYYSGTLSFLISKLNLETNADLLCSYIKKFNYEKTDRWIWINKYLENETNRDINIQKLLKSCLSFFRISKFAIEFLQYYNNSNIKSFNYELSLPTILHNYGFKIKSLSSNNNEDDKDFFYTNIIKPENFYVGKNWYSTNDMDDAGKDLLYTCYKSKQKSEIVITEKIYHKILNPVVSIVIPVWNCKEYIEDCINSCLNQDFEYPYEIIIVNDGSTDDSKKIINSIKDNKIVYIEKEHSGISDTLNIGIANANGQYIARMDADDIMLKNRLAIQYQYMLDNPNCDVVSNSFYYGNNIKNTKVFNLGDHNIKLRSLENGNPMCHPTVFFKAESIKKLPYLYEQYFDGAEDYKLWFTLLLNNLSLCVSNTPVLFYRMHNKQASCGNEINVKRSKTLANRIKRLVKTFNENIRGSLTVVIPFKNEGYEIEKTVVSIRCTAKYKIPIILINDNSDDGYDYKTIANRFDCIYIEHDKSIGVAQSRDEGVNLSTTENFVLLDGHMRFYDDDWDNYIIESISNHQNAILSSETITISRTKNGCYKNENGVKKFHNAGACINMKDGGHEFTAKWCNKDALKVYDDNIQQTPALMGACYCSNKTWWNYIGGLQGLIMWGNDEPLISIKTWLCGGEILLLRDLYVGHIYRDKAPYPFINEEIHSNYIFLNNLFAYNYKNKPEFYNNSLKKRLGDSHYNKSFEKYNENKEYKESLIKDFWQNKAIHNMDWFFKEINDKCMN